MTNKEAIEILKKYKDESEEDYYVKRAEALGKGIEALENQKTLQEELEKIKAEIDLIKDSKRLIDNFDSGCERIKDLLDHHISELKGE